MTPSQRAVLETIDSHMRDTGQPLPALRLAAKLVRLTEAERRQLDIVVDALRRNELVADRRDHTGAGLVLTRYGYMALNEARKGRRRVSDDWRTTAQIEEIAERAQALIDEIRALTSAQDAGPAELLACYERGRALTTEWEAVRP